MRPGHVVLSSGTSEAYARAFQLLCDPGDAVLVPRPSYPLFQFLADLESVEAVPYPLAYDGTWHLRLSDLAGARTAAHARGRGRGAQQPDRLLPEEGRMGRALALLRRGAGLAVIADEVFADFPLRDDPARVAPWPAAGPR